MPFHICKISGDLIVGSCTDLLLRVVEGRVVEGGRATEGRIWTRGCSSSGLEDRPSDESLGTVSSCRCIPSLRIAIMEDAARVGVVYFYQLKVRFMLTMLTTLTYADELLV